MFAESLNKMTELVDKMKLKIAFVLEKERKKSSDYKICKNSGLQVNQLDSIINKGGYTIDSAIKVLSAIGYNITIQKKK